MVFFEHIEPRLPRFNSHTPQVIYSRFNTIVTPFIGASVRNPVKVVFPCCQTINAGITTDFCKCHIHGCRNIWFNYLLIKKLLKDNQLTRTITGVEAIEKIKAQTFDIVFMDMRMPVMNGLEATSLIREFNQTTPIIALTANAFDSDRENALAAGCNHFMTKPVKKRELMDLLFRYFKQQPQ